MKITKIIPVKMLLIGMFITLVSVPCWVAASNPETKTNIGLLAQLYEEGADMAQKILVFASLNNQDIAQLAFIGRRLPCRFPKLYEDAMEELFKRRVEQLLQRHNGNAQEALFDAAENNYPWAIEYLVRHGADVNARNSHGNTPLMIAAGRDQADVVAQLLQRGADVNAKNNYGETPLMRAARFGDRADVAAQLIAAGADVNAKDNYGETPLMVVVQNGHADVVAQLLQRGADVNAKDNNGMTPLMWAAESGHKNIAKLLIKNGATYSDLPELLRLQVEQWLGE